MAPLNLQAAVLRLERQVQLRTGVNKVEARFAIAAMAGLGHGTIERVARDRVKDISHRVRARLCALLVEQWQSEIVALTRELEQLRSADAGQFNDDEAREVEASLQTARARMARLKTQ